MPRTLKREFSKGRSNTRLIEAPMLEILHLTAFWLGSSSARLGFVHAERRPIDVFTSAVLSEDFECRCGMIHRKLVAHPQIQTVSGEGVGGSTAIRASYSGDRRGSSHLSRSFWLPARRLEYTLSYDVKFDRYFQFVKGGKLHGLAPDQPVSGGRAVGATTWSARVMWRRKGKVGTYTYHQSQRGRYGDRGRAFRPFSFRKGTYYAVSLHVKLNEPAASSNGFVRLYVDGNLVEMDEGLQFRSVGDPRSLISRFMFTTFHGGHDVSWAPRTRDGHYATVHAYFDNIAVYAGQRIREKPGH